MMGRLELAEVQAGDRENESAKTTRMAGARHSK
jgi:hypothetical protein